jgi:hypothetical protein
VVTGLRIQTVQLSACEISRDDVVEGVRTMWQCTMKQLRSIIPAGYILGT